MVYPEAVELNEPERLLPVDPELYAKLLADVRPGVIEDEEEAQRLLGILEALLDKEDAILAEEEKLAALLTLLLEAYQGGYSTEDEDDNEPDQPHEILQGLLQERGMPASDLVDIFGNPQAVQDMLQGNRLISRGQAKALGRLFAVPAKVFLGDR